MNLDELRHDSHARRRAGLDALRENELRRCEMQMRDLAEQRGRVEIEKNERIAAATRAVEEHDAKLERALATEALATLPTLAALFQKDQRAGAEKIAATWIALQARSRELLDAEVSAFWLGAMFAVLRPDVASRVLDDEHVGNVVVETQHRCAHVLAQNYGVASAQTALLQLEAVVEQSLARGRDDANQDEIFERMLECTRAPSLARARAKVFETQRAQVSEEPTRQAPPPAVAGARNLAELFDRLPTLGGK